MTAARERPRNAREYRVNVRKRRGSTNGRRKLRKLGSVCLVCPVVVTLVTMALVVAGCGGSTPTPRLDQARRGGSGSAGTTRQADPVVIGAIVSTTGPAAALGEQERDTLKMMQDVINGSGGILGRPLKVVTLDDKSDPNEAVTDANQLISQDKAVAIIVATSSPSTLAVKQITAKKGLPQIAIAAANEITDQPPSDWIWRTPAKDSIAVACALTYVSKNMKVKKIAILHDENAFGSSGADVIVKTAATYGLQVVGNESYKTADTDLTAQLTKIRGDNPEAIIVWGTNPGPALAAKNMKQLGMTIPYVGSHGIANSTFIQLAGAAAEGVVLPAGKLLVPSSVTDPKQKAVVDNFVKLYKNSFGVAPNTFAGHAYDAITLLANAIQKAGNTDPAGIQAALNATQGFAGADGIFNYSKTNHDGLVVSDMIMVKIQGGTGSNASPASSKRWRRFWKRSGPSPPNPSRPDRPLTPPTPLRQPARHVVSAPHPCDLGPINYKRITQRGWP